MLGFLLPFALAQLAQICFNGMVLPTFAAAGMPTCRPPPVTEIIGYRASAIARRLSFVSRFLPFVILRFLVTSFYIKATLPSPTIRAHSQ